MRPVEVLFNELRGVISSYTYFGIGCVEKYKKLMSLQFDT